MCAFVPARLDNINLLLNAATALHVYKRKQSPRLFQHNSRPWCSRAARNIKWRSSSKQCNSFLFPLFLPLFPAPRLRRASGRRRRFETLIASSIYKYLCDAHTQVWGLLRWQSKFLFFIVAIAGSSVRRMSNGERESERAPFFAAKINCGAASL